MSALPDRSEPDAGEAPQELHIAGVLLRARTCSLERVGTALADMPEVEVFQIAEDGRLVLVVEGDSARAVTALLESIRELDGVLSVSLVYQHAESVADLLEDMEP